MYYLKYSQESALCDLQYLGCDLVVSHSMRINWFISAIGVLLAR